ncbi:MAG: TRAP transporter substrate-binding protein DctP [Pseudomonadales bacterium]|nr:TRAP transporter substrate-binding protein DctP [Pseudomonadales bacterium]
MMRKLLITLALGAIAISLPLQAATTLKIATLSPEGSGWMIAMRAASKEIKAKTEGRVKFRFYPGGVMGNDKAVLKKIRFGQLQGAAFSGGALSSKAPNTQIYSLPHLFNSYGEVDYVRQHMDSSVEAEFEKAGFVNFGLAEGGFAYLMSKKPIVDADKLKDNRVWVPSDDPASDAASTAFELSPTPLFLGDVLAGLQTDLIDSVFASPIAAIALQWHTQVKYITDLPLVYFYAIMAVDQKAFKKISLDDQKIVREVMRIAFKKVDKQNRKDNEAAFVALKKQGIEMLTLTPEQTAGWNKRNQAATDLFIDIKGGVNSATYKKAQQLLKEYRSQQVAK